MITAVDSSVLLDVFSADKAFGPRSNEALQRALAEGSLVACEVVWAEVAAHFPSSSAAADALRILGVTFGPVGQVEALSVGRAWSEYRRRGGKRSRVIADFLIGAHAAGCADRLLTRDRGFYRSYFRRLTILDPTGPD